MNDIAKRLVVRNTQRVSVSRVTNDSSQFIDVQPVAYSDRHEADACTACEVGLFLGGRWVPRVAIGDDNRNA